MTRRPCARNTVKAAAPGTESIVDHLSSHHQIFVMVVEFAVGVLDKNEPLQCGTMETIDPVEAHLHSQRYPQHRPCDRLDDRVQRNVRKCVEDVKHLCASRWMT